MHACAGLAKANIVPSQQCKGCLWRQSKMERERPHYIGATRIADALF